MSATVTPQIVNLNASVAAAPSPSTLMQSGALVSVGGTTLTTGTYQYCANAAAVTAILAASGGNKTELANMAATYFAQGSAVGVYVLEIGANGGTVATQIAALNTWIQASPNVFYAYLLPNTWDASGGTVQSALAANYGSATGRTYFFINTTSSTFAPYTSKAMFTVVPSPTAAGTEHQAAAFFYQWLANNPGLAAPAAPMNFRFAYGVTPWATNGNIATIDNILTGFSNLILTGAEGGISTATQRNGTTMDGNQAMFWYAIDWLQLNAKQQLAAAIINGSNSSNPLYYNQFGINYLLGILRNLGNTGTSVGLLLSATFAAVPFTTFTSANPADYAAGIYNGFSCTATPQLGFTTITFNLSAVTFT